jgi:hypothetical protein
VQVNPIGLEHIGWRYYIVWLCVLVSNFTIIFLFYPEVSQSSQRGESPIEHDVMTRITDQKSQLRRSYAII